MTRRRIFSMSAKPPRKLSLAHRTGLNQKTIAPPPTAPPANQAGVVRTIKKKVGKPVAKVAAQPAEPVAVEAAAAEVEIEQPAAPEPAAAAPPPRAPPAAAAAAATASSEGRPWTVTVALPGSIVDNAQTQELRSYLVGQVARACAVFNVDEIVVFGSTEPPPPDARGRTNSSGAVFMAR